MNSYHYAYRRCEGGMIMTGSISNTTFEKVVDILKDVSTDNMEIIYIIKVAPELKR